MIEKIKQINLGTAVIWLVYVALLVVMLPHTQRAAARFEPENIIGAVSSFAFALVFELAYIVFMHGQVEHLKQNRRARANEAKSHHLWRKWGTAYSAALLVALIITFLANTWHTTSSVDSQNVYDVSMAFVFGAVLPVMSILFASILARVDTFEIKIESDLNQQIAKLNRELGKVNQQNDKLTQQIQELNQRESLPPQLNPFASDLIQYIGGGEMSQADIADRHGVSKSKVTRLVSTLNGNHKE
jgi:hypothetical protein